MTTLIDVAKKYWDEHPEKFEEHLASFHGLLNHPKRHLVYSLAYGHGHAEGYESIVLWYAEYAELVK